MKKMILFLMIIVFLSGFAVAFTNCDLNISLLNQDPYPAIPGDYVKLVIQVRGIDNPNCGEATFELMNEYPIHLDPGQGGVVTIRYGGYVLDYTNVLLLPYKVRIDENALNGDQDLKFRYITGDSPTYITKTLEINVQDSRSDFEVSVKDYNSATKILTFEILNIGENDVEALTIDLPIQSNLDVKGSRRNIIGSLDSNDDTTFSFEAIPKQGQIDIMISYNDQNNVRRTAEKSVMFNAEDFQDRVRDQKSTPVWIYLLVIIIIIVVIVWWRRRAKRKKLDHLKQHHMR